MDYQNFTNSKIFLENMILKCIENKHYESLKDLLNAYTSILNKQTDLDIQFLKSDEQVRKEWYKNQAEITKLSIKQNNHIIHQ